MSIYNYLAKKPNGDLVSMQTYENKVMLICNTASKCQYTYQYEDLQKLYTKYASEGFTVLSFPCDQFGNQNPETAEESVIQCKGQFGVTYPIYDKVEVNGPTAHPLFQFLKHATGYSEFKAETMSQKMIFEHLQAYKPEYLIGNNIRWNFTKFLVDRKGQVVTRFEPEDSIVDIEEKIKSLL